jgi:hypothetical protein
VAFAVILNAAAAKSGREAVLRELFSLTTEVPSDTAAGRQLLNCVLDEDASVITDSIERTAGLRPGSAADVLETAAPVVLTYLRQYIREHRLNRLQFLALLKEKSSLTESLLPPGIGHLWTSPPESEQVIPDVQRSFIDVAAEPQPVRWLLAVLAALAGFGLFLIVQWQRGRGH